MFILLTKFIHPIDKKIVLSNHFEFYFDNPRSEEEIKTVRDMIKKDWDLCNIYDDFESQRFPLKVETSDPGEKTFETVIEEICDNHFSKEKTKQIVLELEGKPEKIMDFLAKYWVIVRYENQEMQNELAEARKQYQSNTEDYRLAALTIDDDSHIFVKRNIDVVNFSYVLSLLVLNDSYFGWNFLLTESLDQLLIHDPSTRLLTHILWISFGLHPLKNTKDSLLFGRHNFVFFLTKIEQYISLIDKGLDSKVFDEDLLLYIGETLSLSKPYKNEFSSLARATEIIEMLIAHQPDVGRFNVEDSISKQFILKTSILAYITNPMVSLEKSKKNLKEIYCQRSHIVHGNFSQVRKFIEKIEKEGGSFGDLISDCYFYIRLCLLAYLKDPELVKFIKEN